MTTFPSAVTLTTRNAGGLVFEVVLICMCILSLFSQELLRVTVQQEREKSEKLMQDAELLEADHCQVKLEGQHNW